MSPCVYRMYDADGQLLYVGCTMNFLARLEGYRYKAGHFAQTTRIDIEHFPSLGEALVAEQLAIVNEKPLLNRDKRVNRNQQRQFRAALDHMRRLNAPCVADLSDEDIAALVGDPL